MILAGGGRALLERSSQNPDRHFDSRTDPVIGWLNGTIIVLIDSGEDLQFGAGDIDWSFEHIPGHSLGTGRSGEGTGERIVAGSGREKILCVDGNGRDFDDFPFFRGKILPESIEERRGRRIPFEKYGNDRKVTICVRVDKVGDQIVFFPVDVLFTRMMEMKLLESVNLVADGQCAAWSIIHHNRVAIIDDAERHSACN